MHDTPIQCVGIILDGNRRWAKERGLPKLEGHRRGFNTLIECVRWTRDAGIKHLAVFMFSTENWDREPAEVSYLMDLFREGIKKELKEFGKENVQVRFIGQRERFSKDLQDAMDNVEQETAGNTGITLWACLSYGGRAEIVAAARALQEKEIPITEESLRGAMWSAGMPDPNLIIRTSGEKRLSNFLLWQAAYSELFFPDVRWPDFTQEQFQQILAEYEKRERRLGR